MTRAAILTLTGPPLSEAVAEHVMGWQRKCLSEAAQRMGSTWAGADDNWHFIPCRAVRPGDAKLFDIVAPVWEPHRDIRAAWEVFMAVPGEKKTLRSLNGRFYAAVDDGDLVEAETPELAICRASILAVR